MMIAADAVLTGWYIGFIIATVVISVIVVLAGMILGLARRIGVQAEAIVRSLDEARINTLPLWQVDNINESLRRSTRYAEQARAELGGA